MKKIVSVVALTLVFAVSAIAADKVVYNKAKLGAVTFDHKAHQGRAECKACHEGKPAKIVIDKTVAHVLCKDCHKAKNVGVEEKCGFCHKK
jgi:hypothetical protein